MIRDRIMVSVTVMVIVRIMFSFRVSVRDILSAMFILIVRVRID